MSVLSPRVAWLLLSVAFELVGSTALTENSTAPVSSSSATAAATFFFTGDDLGVVTTPSAPKLMQDSPDAVKDAAAAAMTALLQTKLGLTGSESIVPIASQPVRYDNEGRVHVRLKQYVDGLPLEGASLIIHFDAVTGQVLAANGDVHSTDSIAHADQTISLSCVAAMEVALHEYLGDGSMAPRRSDGAWRGDCEVAAVQGRDGKAYLAYKRVYEIQPKLVATIDNAFFNGSMPQLAADPDRVDRLFAERTTGRLVAVHPMVYRARSMRTYDCHNQEDYAYCTWITDDPNYISTGDAAVDDAHNHAIDVYNFYATYFDQIGMDDNDMTTLTYAHYGYLFNDAYFKKDFGGLLLYGDGNGNTMGYWGQFDMVAHEYSHGVSYFSSNILYYNEPGAISEAFSDAMAATADRRVLNKDSGDVWRIGEDIDQTRKGIRNMADPTEFGHPDYYANRFNDSRDDGSVHANAGIMDKAFYLMVQGGTHPLSGIYVPPLNSDFDESLMQAATILYNAITKWATEWIDFVTMRWCTEQSASSSQLATVRAAWDAVGVKEVLLLVAGVPYTVISLPFDHDAQVFQLDRQLNPGECVTCSITGGSGDPDLTVRYGRPPDLYPNAGAGFNDCWDISFSADATCTTWAATTANTFVYVAVEAFTASSNIQLLCDVQVQGFCYERPNYYP